MDLYLLTAASHFLILADELNPIKKATSRLQTRRLSVAVKHRSSRIAALSPPLSFHAPYLMYLTALKQQDGEAIRRLVANRTRRHLRQFQTNRRRLIGTRRSLEIALSVKREIVHCA